jgi:hypothetical protein
MEALPMDMPGAEKVSVVLVVMGSARKRDILRRLRNVAC